jgi:hypothetical protein
LTPTVPEPRDVIVSIGIGALANPPPRSSMDPTPNTDLRSGELLTMGDGSRWFHPFSGAAPLRLN